MDSQPQSLSLRGWISPLSQSQPQPSLLLPPQLLLQLLLLLLQQLPLLLLHPLLLPQPLLLLQLLFLPQQDHNKIIHNQEFIVSLCFAHSLLSIYAKRELLTLPFPGTSFFNEPVYRNTFPDLFCKRKLRSLNYEHHPVLFSGTGSVF